MNDYTRDVVVSNDDITITLQIHNSEVSHLECREVFEDVLRGAGYTLKYEIGDDEE